MFDIQFTPEASDDLAVMRKYDQQIVVDGIEMQLRHQPNVETRNRKRLRPNDLAEWELRIEPFRVFYDVDEELLKKAKKNDLLLQAKDGSEYIVTAIDDFDREIAWQRKNKKLMALLDQRARQTKTIPLDEVKRRFGLK